MGEPLKNMGKFFDNKKILNLDIPNGTVVHIDNFGLMKFTGNLDGLKENDSVKIKINNKVIDAVYTKRMMSKETGEYVVYPGSSLNLPELGMVRRDGARELDIKIGDIIEIIKA